MFLRFEASYTQAKPIDIEGKLDFLTHEIESMQLKQKETVDAVNNMKRKLLIIELPSSAYSQP